MSDSLRPHESQHARPPCPSPTPGVHSDSRPSSRWCHPAISSSVIPFCLQSFLASESFQMSQFIPSGGQSIAVSASASILPMNIQDWFPLEWTVGSPCSPRDSEESSPTPQFKSICERVVYKITLFLHLFNCFFLGSVIYFSWLDVALCSRSFWRSLPRCSGVMLTTCCVKALPPIHGQLCL